ncbi:MAG: CDP-alcohol phosphatidyltransferase family protein, partial [Thermodesulfobacteriota bacterium]|nr:CDP-alcohol phosphatidyltransferase family protein [Thermodesulfobacteriota bacterium]
MPSIYDIKPGFQNFLRPFVRFLAHWGITANHVTIAAVILSAVAGGSLFMRADHSWPFLCLPFVLITRMGMNAIDGMLAREHHMKTRLGALLNELGDVVSDSVIYLPFGLIPGLSAPLVVGIVTLALISEMTGVVAVQIGSARRYDGPMGKSDRAFAFGILALAVGFGCSAFLWLNVFLGIVLLLLIITIVNRARMALK